jgi:hypothetical protein
MSEDVDFKITPLDTNPLSKTKRRKKLGDLRDRITASLQATGFSIDPADSTQVRSRDDNRYTIYQLQYVTPGPAGEPLRPAIQIELNYAALRWPFFSLPVASLVAEAFGRSPELPTVASVGVAETAAEKLVSLTRRTATELAGVSRDQDPTLVRHIYDLHVTRSTITLRRLSSWRGRSCCRMPRSSQISFPLIAKIHWMKRAAPSRRLRLTRATLSDTQSFSGSWRTATAQPTRMPWRPSRP